MATLTVTQDEDYRDGTPPISIGTDAIVFNASGGATARFLSLQFNDVLIDNNVAITGDSHSNLIAVHMDGDSLFSAAGWTFTTWTVNDGVLVFGTDAAETITGSSGPNTIRGDGGVDTLVGGDSDDTFSYQDVDDFVSGETVDGKGGTDRVSMSNAAGSFDLSGVLTSIEELSLGNTLTITLDHLDIGLVVAGITSVIGNTANAQNLIINGGSVDLGGVTFTSWTDGQDTITVNGNAVSNNNIVGSSQNDTIFGGGNGDDLDGGGGVDRLVGGGFGDSYRVDNAGDVVDESVAGSNGYDTVIASIDFSLADAVHVKGAVESLILAHGVATNATGNALDNGVNGNNNDNLIDGGAGADQMKGRLGNDTYVVDNFGDVVDEAASGGGTDLVLSSISFSLSDPVHAMGPVENLTLTGTAGNATGNALANVLTGNALANLLDGLGSFDTMRGLGGNDTYFVDHQGDVVDENQPGSGGTDEVRSAISFSLANTVTTLGSVENLTLLGSGNLDGTGNGLANLLVGNGGANALSGEGGDDGLDGGGGADTMIGGAGNDSYTVDDAGDVIDESASGSNGNDTVFAFIDFSLADADHARGAVENLTLGGSAVRATGNLLANTITGNAAANVLNGRDGSDILSGKDGNDQFLFEAPINKDKSVNVDHITDFTHLKDDILLDKSIFTKLKLGSLKKGAFSVGKKAKDGNNHILFNKKTDEVAYDKDGDHKAKAIVFAVLDGSPDDLSHKDFVVVA